MTKNWINTVPPFDSQVSTTNIGMIDALDCVAESFCHIFYCLTGVRVSPRALAVMARLDLPENRNTTHVLDVVNKMGLVLWTNCPTPDIFTFASYYTPLTEAENKPFKVSVSLALPDLNISPLWTEIAWGLNLPVATRHMVAQINGNQYFDSEAGGAIKPLNYGGAQVVYQTSLKVNSMNEAKVVKSKTSPTVYICYPIPDMDYLQKTANLQGIILPNPVPDSDSL